VTIQEERQDAPQRTNPFTVPTPQRVKADPQEKRLGIFGVPIAVVLAVFTVLPNHGLTSSEPTPAPTAVVQTHHAN
jgi:hypothetical protein